MNREDRSSLSVDVRLALLEQELARLISDVNMLRVAMDEAIAGLRVAVIVAFAAVGVALLIIGGAIVSGLTDTPTLTL